jgi:hypothetical protein
LCFSFANIKIVNTNSAVKITSMNKPLVTDVPLLNVVLTFSCVGNKPNTNAEAAIAPTICAKKRNTARTKPMAPVSSNARVT